MIHYSPPLIAEIIGASFVTGDPEEDYPISRILTDSRTVLSSENAVFFALKGNNHNGHQFIADLIGKGVRVFVVSQPVRAEELVSGIILLKVDDTLKALQKLAAFHRKQFSYPVVGITGSNGKTIIKEWLNDLLSDQFSIVKSPRSYNSQVGVPLSVWQMDFHHNLALFEAGISKPGEMEHLQQMILPDCGIFTNIGDAHQENFDSVIQKTEEKLVLFRKVKQLIFCADHIHKGIIDQFCLDNGIQKFDWSLHDEPSRIRFSLEITNKGASVMACYDSEKHRFMLPFSDPSSIENACHCYAAIVALGAMVEKTLTRFSKLESLAMRLEIKRGINNCLIINDYYNSDINSIGIGINVLRQQSNKEQLTRIVILSDIKQSGYPDRELYSRVNNLLETSGVDLLIGIGPAISSMESLFSRKSVFYLTTGEYLRNFNPDLFKNAAILIKGARDFRLERIAAYLEEKAHQTVLEINLNALTDNLSVFRKMIRPETKVMVMVKAFSYGSGDVEVARLLQYQRVDYLAVAVADEGVQLRKAGITTKIVVMNPEKQSFQNIIDFQLEPNIYSRELLEEFTRTLVRNGIAGFPIHLKIDTGMNRLGFKGQEQVTQIGKLLKHLMSVKIQSVFSHLVASDDPVFDKFTQEQVSTFLSLCTNLKAEIGYSFMRHILNSAGVERFPGYQLEMVRLGIGLYGISSARNKLRNISRLKTTVSQIKEAGPEETVSYNRSGRLTGSSVIAILPVGYADGLDRRLGNSNGKVYINGCFAPFIGNICMDMSMIDITGIDAKPGDEVEIFGDHIPVSEIAEKCGTISYEILTGISQRVKRTYIQE